MFKGYKFIEERYIEDVNSKCILLEHEKTGAKVFLMENSDDNKTFGIGFKTLPKDNTGICHIIEHCVLSGSRKFKTKEPFMDMYKNSLATFLNAMTFPDKTIYPVSSRNDKDFSNLMDVYLDSVFYPVMKEDKRIFMQEGWHYEIENPNDELNIKGVVYNEMKGAYSNPDLQLYLKNNASLCPDTVYAVESGGEPYTIPKLTYEDFCEFHSKYYHPSNAFIYLYGSCDMAERLEFIDREYLSNFDKKEFENFEGSQKPFEKPKNVFDEYSISKDEDTKNKTYLLYSACLGEKTNLKDGIVSNLLNLILIENQGAYLKEALLKANICEDVSSMYMESTKYLSFGVYVTNSNRENLDKFKEIIEEQLNLIIKNGIDRKKLESALNRFEFSVRELSNSTTTGIGHFINIFDYWLYGRNPVEALIFNEAISEIRDDILNNRLLERTIEEKILRNNHKVFLVLSPSAGLSDKKENAQREWLKRYKESLNEMQLNKLVENTKTLIEYQSAESSEEAKNTIPKLNIDDIERKLKEIPIEVEEKNGISVLKHNIFTYGINYVDIVFDLRHISKDEIIYLGLIDNLISSLSKKTMDYKEYATEKYLHCGGIGTSIRTYTNSKNKEKFTPKFIVGSKFLSEKIEDVIRLIRILLKDTLFEDKDRIKEELLSIKSIVEQDVVTTGHSYGMDRSRTYFSDRAVYNDLLNGISFIKFIQDLCENFDEKIDNVIEKMKFVYNRMFKSNGVILNITTSEDNFEVVEKSFIEFLNELERVEDSPYNLSFDKKNLKEAISTSSDVNYVTYSVDLNKYGMEYNGVFGLISNLMSTTYLHNQIRAMGGAYGAGMSVDKDSILSMYSYRDPNIKSTKETFRNVGKYLMNLEINQDDFNNFKISTTKRFDPLYTPHEKGIASLSMYISGVTKEEIQNQFEELLNSKPEDLKYFGEKINGILEMEDNYVVVGNSEQIKENKEEFSNIINLRN